MNRPANNEPNAANAANAAEIEQRRRFVAIVKSLPLAQQLELLEIAEKLSAADAASR